MGSGEEAGLSWVCLRHDHLAALNRLQGIAFGPVVLLQRSVDLRCFHLVVLVEHHTSLLITGMWSSIRRSNVDCLLDEVIGFSLALDKSIAMPSSMYEAALVSPWPVRAPFSGCC
jgi:hypothetical protein